MPTLSADSSKDENASGKPLSSLEAASVGSLLRSYLVYTLICTPGLVDYSPTILHSFTHSFIPGLKTITESIVRLTFFGQFVPGENVEECLTTMKNLHERGVGSMLNYSAEADLGSEPQEEVDLEEKQRDERLQEVFRALKKSGDFERSLPDNERGATSFALKVVSVTLFF